MKDMFHLKTLLDEDDRGDRVKIPEYFCKDYKERLHKIKGQIDPVYKEWDMIKNMIHDYEYVYTSSSNVKKNISHKVPVSRSYFKMKELVIECPLELQKDTRIVCVAEAPGGFIQCLQDSGVIDIHGITLVSSDKKVPYWNRVIRVQGTTFHKGVTGDGDLYNFQNIMKFVKDIGMGAVDIVTGDGGFDTSGDYNEQETRSYKLIYSEVYLALLLQKKGGVFICKMFDMFESKTISLIYILQECYEEVMIYKPCVSRDSNSEKYIICKGYLGHNKDIGNLLTRRFEDNQLEEEVSVLYLERMDHYNKLYTSQQEKSIEMGLRYIKNKYRGHGPSKTQIKLAKQWCNKYQVTINSYCEYLG